MICDLRFEEGVGGIINHDELGQRATELEFGRVWSSLVEFSTALQRDKKCQTGDALNLSLPKFGLVFQKIFKVEIGRDRSR